LPHQPSLAGTAGLRRRAGPAGGLHRPEHPERAGVLPGLAGPRPARGGAARRRRGRDRGHRGRRHVADPAAATPGGPGESSTRLTARFASLGPVSRARLLLLAVPALLVLTACGNDSGGSSDTAAGDT